MKRKEKIRPYIEEDETGKWASGLKLCANVFRSSAEKMRRGIWPGNWRAEVGNARLLETLADKTYPRKHPDQSKIVITRPRLSDGKKSDIPRKDLVA